jgi:hypothetical protein
LIRRFGIWIVSSAALVLATGCFYGFAGGGLPSHIKTMAILPFDNQTSTPELTNELYEQMRRDLQRKLGVRDAPAERADAIVRGTITTYDADVPVGFSSDPAQALTARRRLQLIIDIEIVDQSNGKVLLPGKGLRAEGDYAERAEAEGRKQAIEKLVREVIEKVQAQW